MEQNRSSSGTSSTLSSTRTRRSGRSNSLNSNSSTINTDASPIDPNLEASIHLLQQINDYFIQTEQSYIFQIHSKPKLLAKRYDWYVFSLLHYGTEAETVAGLQALGLCHKHGAAIFLNHQKWRKIEERVDGIWYHMGKDVVT